MGTNFYFMSRNKELMQTCFGGEYIIVDEPYFGYRCHLNKLSCGWRPLFQKHKAFDTFRKLEAFYREHQADLEIYNEYRMIYSWEDYYELVYEHSRLEPEPMKWVYNAIPAFVDKNPHLRTVMCNKEEVDIYAPFNHVEYEESLKKARLKFDVHDRIFSDIKYWNDPDYLFDWTEGEFS